MPTLCFAALLLMLALSSLPETASAGKAIAITPTRIPVNVLPGESRNMEVTLINQGTEEVSLLPKVMMLVEHSEGMPAFKQDSTCSWFSLEREALRIMPSESKTFTFSVAVPTVVDPGSYHFSVTFETYEEGAEGIGLTGGLAVLVDLQVLSDSGGNTENTGISGTIWGLFVALAALLVGLGVLAAIYRHRSVKRAEQSSTGEEGG